MVRIIDMDFDKEKLASLIVKARGNRSINEYAQQSGVTAAHISRLSRGLLGSPPTPQILKKLADKAIDVHYDELMIAAGYLQETVREEKVIYKIGQALSSDPELASFWNEMLRRDDLQIMLKQVKDLSPEAIRRIIRYIKMVEDEEEQE